MYATIETDTEWHGYSAHSREIQQINTFNTEAEMIAWISKRGKYDAKFIAIKYEQLEIETKVTIKTKPVVREMSQLELAGH